MVDPERPSRLPKFLGYGLGAIALSPFVYAGYLLVRGVSFANKHPTLTVAGVLAAGTLAYTLPKIDVERAVEERIANTQKIEQLEERVLTLQDHNSYLQQLYTSTTQADVPPAPPTTYQNLESVLQEPSSQEDASSEHLSRFLSGIAFGVGGTFLFGLGVSYLQGSKPRSRGRQVR